MRDDYLSADWSRHHGQFTKSVRDLFAAAWIALDRLNAIQFDAPWKRAAAPRPLSYPTRGC